MKYLALIEVACADDPTVLLQIVEERGAQPWDIRTRCSISNSDTDNPSPPIANVKERHYQERIKPASSREERTQAHYEALVGHFMNLHLCPIEKSLPINYSLFSLEIMW